VSQAKTLIVACPHCGKESPWDIKNPYRPFCSERCKMMDLGKWADEQFRVELSEQEDLPGSAQQ
jgi:endogenous inhibitor of DNA gyrase (YacG/DUF329 family)